MRLLLWVVLGVVSIIGLPVLAARPLVHRNVPLSRLRHFVWSLLFQMAPGGFFIADRRGGPGFLQLALREVQGDTYTVEFGLPDIDWSANEFDSLHLALERQAFKPNVEARAGSVERFLRVVIQGLEPEVIDRAVELFRLTAVQLHWGEESAFDVRFGGGLDNSRVRALLAKSKRRGA